jgi:RNA polymerase-binding protein DksA
MDSDLARRRLDEERRRLMALREKRQLQEAEPLAAGELSTADQHPAELATDTFEQERELTILEMLDGQLRDVDYALSRLEQGTYGICEACGKPIAEARLEARPAARFCIEDQARAEKEVNAHRAAG